MTRREFLAILAGAANEQSRTIAHRLYAQGRGERRAGKLAPNKTPKKQRK